MLRMVAARTAPGPTLAHLDRLVLTGEALAAAASIAEVGDLVTVAARDLAGSAGATLLVVHPAIAEGRHVAGRASGAERVVDVPTRGPVASTLLVHGGPAATPALDGVLRLLGQQAAAALDRLTTVVPLERVDALTGAGNLRQAVADVASLRADDGIVVAALDDGAPFEVVVALAAHLRTSTRPPGDSVCRVEDGRFQVVLRGLKAPVGEVAQRLAAAWRAEHPGHRLTVGCASHVAGSSPLETRDDAVSAFDTASALGGGAVLVAPPRR